jgi:DNA-binding NarL/FixJ family response regulator
MSAIKVLLADDHPIVREGLRAYLSTQRMLEVVGEAVDGMDVIEKAAALAPDVVLMDIAMPVLDGIDATREIREELPKTRVIVLTGSAATSDVSRARTAGASGFVTKDQIAGDLLQAILEAAAG